MTKNAVKNKMKSPHGNSVSGIRTHELCDNVC